MGKFKQSLITAAGKSILLGGEVTYTTAKLFSQDVSSMTDDQVRALTALTGQLMSVGVSVEAMDNSTVSVKAVFSNKGLTADITFSSVGWFAKAGSDTETLIAVTPIEGTKILCAGLPNSSTDAINIAMNMAIGDSTTVNVVIDPAGTVSPVDLDSAISKIQTDVDSKATKADVDKEITTLTADKANSADVYTKSDVDMALSNSYFRKQGMNGGGDLIEIYANATKQSNGGYAFDIYDSDWTAYNLKDAQSDITNLQNTVNNINSTRTPIVTGASGDDLFAFETNQIRLYDGNGAKCKNLPPAANTQYFTVQYVFEGPKNDGIAIYRTPANVETWMASCEGKVYNTDWIRVANSTDLTNLQNTIQANKTDVSNLANRVTAIENKPEWTKANSESDAVSKSANGGQYYW